MVSIARRNMLAGKSSFAFSVAGVAVATMLLTFTLALYRGWSERLTAYIDDTEADLWVVQKGAESFFTVSVVNNRNVNVIRDIEGVERVSTLAGKTLRIHVMSARCDGRQVAATMTFAYDGRRRQARTEREGLHFD